MLLNVWRWAWQDKTFVSLFSCPNLSIKSSTQRGNENNNTVIECHVCLFLLYKQKAMYMSSADVERNLCHIERQSLLWKTHAILQTVSNLSSGSNQGPWSREAAAVINIEKVSGPLYEITHTLPSTFFPIMIAFQQEGINSILSPTYPLQNENSVTQISQCLEKSSLKVLSDMKLRRYG